MSKTIFTRNYIKCPLLGAPSDFKGNVLPTKEDVLKCYLLTRYNLKADSRKEPSFFQISNLLADKILGVWKNASLPTVLRKRVLQLIKMHHDKYLQLIRYPKSKRNENYTLKLQDYKTELKSLFDISACKCEDLEKCVCKKDKKVPPNEHVFLLDQRRLREMFIGCVDTKETQKLVNRARRIEQVRQREVWTQNVDPEKEIIVAHEITKNQESTDSETPIEPSQNTVRLPNLAKICDRYGLSDRSAAAVATAVLQDFGIVTKAIQTQVIDKNKLRRAREKSRKNYHNTEVPHLKALYFDGRKDKTLVIEDIEGTSHRRTVVEEHISLIQEPGSLFLGHTVPSSGTSKGIFKSIMDFFQNTSELHDLVVIGCDGTVVNTGLKNGIIAQLEAKLGRPLQRFICQLHANELPLRHLFQHLDGQTTGPVTFSGVLGKQIQQCEKLPLVKYETIDCKLPNLDFVNLSTDQKYLYEICVAVSSGECSVELLNRNPGKVSHARWLTLANRILRLYISSESPCENLKDLTHYIIKVYSPLWFEIKCNSSCQNGARHVFQTIKLSRYLRPDLKSIIDPVIQRNAFFAHPENILISMLNDTRLHIRELALRRILNAKQKTSQNIRIFKVPQLNFDAVEYTGLIDWQKNDITCPPLLRNLEIDNLKSIITESSEKFLHIDSFPCHTQAVERCVKLVTEASLSLVGSERRDGFIKSRIDSRLRMPQFESKKDYNQ